MSDPTTTEVAPTQPSGNAKALGKRPAKGDSRTLNFARFVELAKVPATYNPWARRRPFQPRTFGNRFEGDCTRASQALAAMRFERIETSKTITIADEEVHRVYREGCQRHYGTTDDVGMYETDALSDFRNPDYTFKDSDGHPITIDAFMRVNPQDREEVKAAIALSGKWGIKLCLNLPLGFQSIDPPALWDVPRDANGKPRPLIDQWVPGSWGGHSLFADAYDKRGVRLVHTWYEGLGLPADQWPTDEQYLSWDAMAAYSDEMYWLLQSVDTWRAKPKSEAKAVDVAGIIKAVNKVSGVKIKPGRKR